MTYDFETMLERHGMDSIAVDSIGSPGGFGPAALCDVGRTGDILHPGLPVIADVSPCCLLLSCCNGCKQNQQEDQEVILVQCFRW